MPPNERHSELLKLLERYITRLDAESDVDAATVDLDGPLDAAVQRWLQLAIQCCIDLGDSLLGCLGEPEPSRQRDVFPVLERRGIIDGATSRALIDLVRYRNTLIHAYESLSPTQTWTNLTVGLPYLKAFLVSAARLLTS